MNKHEAIAKLKAIKEHSTQEDACLEAGAVLCELLSAMGHQDIVDAYNEIGMECRWVAESFSTPIQEGTAYVIDR